MSDLNLDSTPPGDVVGDDMDDADVMPLVRHGWRSFEMARAYTRELLKSTPTDRWFEIPSGYSTHVGWQVGHLAVASYGLLLFRIRGRSESDLELIPSRFRKRYGKGSRPKPGADANVSPEALLATLDEVRNQAEPIWRSIHPAEVRVAVDPPYAVYPNKLGCLMFASMHEMLHAGQIGAVRRGLDLEPIR